MLTAKIKYVFGFLFLSYLLVLHDVHAVSGSLPLEHRADLLLLQRPWLDHFSSQPDLSLSPTHETNFETKCCNVQQVCLVESLVGREWHLVYVKQGCQLILTALAELLNWSVVIPVLQTVAVGPPATNLCGSDSLVTYLLVLNANQVHCEAVVAVAVAVAVGDVADNDDGQHDDDDVGPWDHQCWHHHCHHRDYRSFLGTHSRKTSKILERCPDLRIEVEEVFDVAVGDYDVVDANIGALQLSHCCHYHVAAWQLVVEHVSGVVGLAEVVVLVQ